MAAGFIAGAIGNMPFTCPIYQALGETAFNFAAGVFTGAVSGAISSAVYGGNWGKNIGEGAMGGAIGAAVGMTAGAAIKLGIEAGKIVIAGMKATYEVVKYIVQRTSDWLIGENFGAGWRAAFSERWVPGPTGGLLPESQAKAMWNIRYTKVPQNACMNGMHAWHAGSNAYFVGQYGIFGAPLTFAAGLVHESPLDWKSFWAEQSWQGTINHVLDSITDIVANGFGISVGAIILGTTGVDAAIKYGNYIPGPGEPDPAFGGHGGAYTGNPSDDWGQYP
jgi:hypothetical protein